MTRLATYTLLLVLGCQSVLGHTSGSDSTQLDVYDLQFTSASGGQLALAAFRENAATVFVLLSPECPLCQNYSLTLNEMLKEYESANVAVVGIFPGTYSSRKQIRHYLKKYKVQFPTLLDPDYTLVKHFGGTTTPEVFLLNAAGMVLYSGAIDNWAYSLGKKRRKITAHYLQDALTETLAEHPVTVSKTEPIGCFIYAVPE